MIRRVSVRGRLSPWASMPAGSASTKIESTSCEVKNAPTPVTHSLRCSRAKTCGGSVRRCCSRQVSETHDAQGPRVLKYQSASRSAIWRTSQAIEVWSHPAVEIASSLQRGRFPVALHKLSHSSRRRHSASSSTTIMSGRSP